jgi:hypothetical protein
MGNLLFPSKIEINPLVSQSINEEPINIESINESCEDDLDWDEIEKSVNDFVIKFKEMKEKGFINNSKPKISRTYIDDEDW